MNFYNEHDPKKAAWLRQLIRDGEIPAGDVDERSITTLSPNDLTGYTQCHFFAGVGGWSVGLALAGWPASEPVWTGSCPCQSISLAGHRKAHADERHLWPAFHALIEVCKPSDIFGEQVANGDGYEWLAGVRADLEGSGYEVGAADLCAAGVGSPQIRQRIYWGAHAEGLDGRAHGLLGSCGVGRASLADRGFPRIFGDGRWTPDTLGRGERLPSIVRSYHGLSAILCGFGDAIVPQLAAQFVRSSIGVIEPANDKPRVHPTQKPVAVMAWCMEQAGVPEGATVCDPYMGSGTTGIACLKTNRNFVGIEKDPEHFKTACARLEAECNQGALL